MKTKKRKSRSGPPLPPTASECGFPVLRDRPWNHRMLRKTASDVVDVLPRTFTELYRPPVRSSNVRLAHLCARRFMFSERLGLRSKAEYMPALQIGKTVHKALELRASGLSFRKINAALRSMHAEWLRTRIQPHANIMGLLPDGTPFSDYEARAIEDLDRSLALVAYLFTKELIDLDHYELLGSEQLITADAQLQTPVRGRLDLVWRRRGTSEIHLWDLKTASPPIVNTARTFRLDIQPFIYRLLAMAAFPDAHVVRFHYAVLRKCTLKYCPGGTEYAVIKPGAKRASRVVASKKEARRLAAELGANIEVRTTGDATYEDYLRRVAGWYLDEEKEATDAVNARNFREAERHATFLRSNFRFPTEPLPHAVAAQLRYTARLANCRVKLDNFAVCLNHHTCAGIGGHSPCSYLPLCTEPRARWTQLMQDLYVQRHREDTDSEESPF